MLISYVIYAGVKQNTAAFFRESISRIHKTAQSREKEFKLYIIQYSSTPDESRSSQIQKYGITVKITELFFSSFVYIIYVLIIYG